VEKKRLFYFAYDRHAREAQDVYEKYFGGSPITAWDKLNSRIRDILVDLRYRGDLRNFTLDIMGDAAQKNDLAEFTKQMSDQDTWDQSYDDHNLEDVPDDRFKARVAYLKTGKPLRLPGGELGSGSVSGVGGGESLTSAALSGVVHQAILEWQSAGIDPARVALLESARVFIASLPANELGLEVPPEFGESAPSILINVHAGNQGWFMDPTPADDVEFQPTNAPGELYAGVNSPAAGLVDLLTVVEHELGHALGLDDLDPSVAPAPRDDGRLVGGGSAAAVPERRGLRHSIRNTPDAPGDESRWQLDSHSHPHRAGSPNGRPCGLVATPGPGPGSHTVLDRTDSADERDVRGRFRGAR
jgi:hypothetical protein